VRTGDVIMRTDNLPTMSVQEDTVREALGLPLKVSHTLKLDWKMSSITRIAYSIVDLSSPQANISTNALLPDWSSISSAQSNLYQSSHLSLEAHSPMKDFNSSSHSLSPTFPIDNNPVNRYEITPYHTILYHTIIQTNSS
jgi:hypothetical protein